MKRFKDGSLRLQTWDYGRNGAYFITVNTLDRSRSFGAISEGHMLLSPEGKIADKHMLEIPKRFPYVDLGEYVIMPDHLHAILIINKPGGWPYVPEFPAGPRTGGFAKGKNPMLNDNLGRILRWYKGRVTYEIHKTNKAFEWQERYHDRIIRDQRAFQNIAYYIRMNPRKWKN